MGTDENSAKLSWWRRRNWWKIGFFVMLVLFEFAREIIVLESNPEPKISTNASVVNIQGYTSATGRWTRIDGGGPLLPSATSITCTQSRGQCVEATANMFDGYLSEPTVETFDATFTPEAINYENNNPSCAHYSIRIDLKLKKVFAVRARKDIPKDDKCKMLEAKMEMTLGDGYQPNEKPLDDHFVPLFSVLGWFTR